jgi:hypothetical protein
MKAEDKRARRNKRKEEAQNQGDDAPAVEEEPSEEAND